MTRSMRWRSPSATITVAGSEWSSAGPRQGSAVDRDPRGRPGPARLRLGHRRRPRRRLPGDGGHPHPGRAATGGRARASLYLYVCARRRARPLRLSQPGGADVFQTSPLGQGGRAQGRRGKGRQPRGEATRDLCPEGAGSRMGERVTTAEERSEDKEFEWSLRPRRLAESIGQEAVKANMEILITAARGRNEPIEHILIAGPPGLGKTTLANIMANEMGVNIRTTSGPAIEHQGALASILTNLEDRDIFFIDEIHRLARPVEESLYPAMEDFKFDFVSGKGAGAQTFRLPLPHFPVICATTPQGILSAPLRDRFGAVYPLYFYAAEELFAIVIRSPRLLKASIHTAAAHMIASRARGTPRGA